MKQAGRVSAAIDVLNEVLTRHRPAAEALKDWGKAHRFAGSSDRHAIGTLVYDSLRHRLSAASQGGADDARHIVFGVLRQVWGLEASAIATLADGQHGPAALSPSELRSLERPPTGLAWHQAANVPAWLAPVFERQFGAEARAEGLALSNRAPVDLRVNTLKADREKVLLETQRYGAVAGPWVETSVRIAAPGAEQKHINVEADPGHGMGFYEVQDTASQIAAALTGVKAGQHVADICAGAGGKTLALAALMKNEGRLVAHDVDKHRLRPIFERVMRAGASCVDVVAAEQAQQLPPAAFDCVVVDAPCSGTGTWRRKPEIKWKLNAKNLDVRLNEQRKVLAHGASLVKTGGTLAYFTCSVLPQENREQVDAFLRANPSFRLVPYHLSWAQNIGGAMPSSADGRDDTLQLTPHQHDVDGFFVALMRKI